MSVDCSANYEVVYTINTGDVIVTNFEIISNIFSKFLAIITTVFQK